MSVSVSILNGLSEFMTRGREYVKSSTLGIVAVRARRFWMSAENADNKRTIREASRWLRVGFFTLTVLGPVINSLTARMRELADARQHSATSNEASAYKGGYAESTPVQPALSESLLELKDRPYAQEVLRRSEELAEELKRRGITLSQVLTERGGKVTHELAELSSELTHDLVERGNTTSRELLKSSA